MGEVGACGREPDTVDLLPAAYQRRDNFPKVQGIGMVQGVEPNCVGVMVYGQYGRCSRRLPNTLTGPAQSRE